MLPCIWPDILSGQEKWRRRIQCKTIWLFHPEGWGDITNLKAHFAKFQYLSHNACVQWVFWKGHPFLLRQMAQRSIEVSRSGEINQCACVFVIRNHYDIEASMLWNQRDNNEGNDVDNSIYIMQGVVHTRSERFHTSHNIHIKTIKYWCISFQDVEWAHAFKSNITENMMPLHPPLGFYYKDIMYKSMFANIHDIQITRHVPNQGRIRDFEEGGQTFRKYTIIIRAISGAILKWTVWNPFLHSDNANAILLTII